MKLSALLVCLLATASGLVSAQSTDYSRTLASSLEKHRVVLRHFYTDSDLSFDSNGQLSSKGTEGFGPTDGTLLIQKVELKPDGLRISALHAVDMLSESGTAWTPTDLGSAVTVEVALPTGESAETAVPQLLSTIFLKQSELAGLACSAAEEQAFQDLIYGLKHHSSRNAKLPNAASLDQIQPFCLPNGEHAYKVERGIKAPRARHAPDPKYAEAARQNRLQGTVVLQCIITPGGNVSTISIVRSMGATLRADKRLQSAGFELDARAVEGVSEWTFEPARFHDTPVPVVIDVEVNFRLQ